MSNTETTFENDQTESATDETVNEENVNAGNENGDQDSKVIKIQEVLNFFEQMKSKGANKAQNGQQNGQQKTTNPTTNANGNANKNGNANSKPSTNANTNSNANNKANNANQQKGANTNANQQNGILKQLGNLTSQKNQNKTQPQNQKNQAQTQIQKNQTQSPTNNASNEGAKQSSLSNLLQKFMKNNEPAENTEVGENNEEESSNVIEEEGVDQETLKKIAQLLNQNKQGGKINDKNQSVDQKGKGKEVEKTEEENDLEKILNGFKIETGPNGELKFIPPKGIVPTTNEEQLMQALVMLDTEKDKLSQTLIKEQETLNQYNEIFENFGHIVKDSETALNTANELFQKIKVDSKDNISDAMNTLVTIAISSMKELQKYEEVKAKSQLNNNLLQGTQSILKKNGLPTTNFEKFNPSKNSSQGVLAFSQALASANANNNNKRKVAFENEQDREKNKQLFSAYENQDQKKLKVDSESLNSYWRDVYKQPSNFSKVQ